MKNIIAKSSYAFLPLLVFVVCFAFWSIRYPQALSFQEQYQLFLWTSDYFVNMVSHIGGFAEYVSEFIVQFYYIGWFGALILALLYTAFSVLVDRNMGTEGKLQCTGAPVAMMMLWLYGDEDMLLSYMVAMVLALLVSSLMRGKLIWYDLVILPLLYWAIGPVVWLYVALRLIQDFKWINMLTVVYIMAIHAASVRFVLDQWPLTNAFLGTNYCREPLDIPTLQIVIPVIVVVLSYLVRSVEKSRKLYVNIAGAVATIAVLFCADNYGFEKDKYELMTQDYLIRNEKWNEVVSMAEKYQVQSNFSSECVNLSLAMTGQLSNRMFNFYQSGEDALLMPMSRDLISNIPTMEAFYRLGMVNECLRYAFDVQESILNGKKSARLMVRIAECNIVNGKYKVASKYLDMLQNTLFYSDWAKEAKTYLGKEDKINNHPIWGRMRAKRFKNDFLFYYPDKARVLGNLFNNDMTNKMALEYFMGQLLLDGDVQSFMHYLDMARQYGGYSSMPYGYQDAVRCIQEQGNAIGSPYAEYVKRMTQGGY